MQVGIEELDVGVHCAALLPSRSEHGALLMV